MGFYEEKFNRIIERMRSYLHRRKPLTEEERFHEGFFLGDTTPTKITAPIAGEISKIKINEEAVALRAYSYARKDYELAKQAFDKTPCYDTALAAQLSTSAYKRATHCLFKVIS